MVKTTKAHFELFKKEVLYWHERLGLIQNVVERPRLLGATTYNFICQNEIMLPLLSYMLGGDNNG